jgi:multiple sugar transport system permease protein
MAFRDPSGTWTLEYFRRMATDVNFWPAIRDTLLLILAIVPVQMALALIMALLLNSGLLGTSFWLYAWAFPLAISDLAAGIVRACRWR